jgi:hypothetical protein
MPSGLEFADAAPSIAVTPMRMVDRRTVPRSGPLRTPIDELANVLVVGIWGFLRRARVRAAGHRNARLRERAGRVFVLRTGGLRPASGQPLGSTTIVTSGVMPA